MSEQQEDRLTLMVLGYMVSSSLPPELQEITWGSHVYLYEMDSDLEVFGYIYTPEEIVNSERDLGADAEEIGAMVTHIRATHSRGGRYGTWYSKAAPEGDIGSRLVYNCVGVITQDDFDAARAEGWSLPTRVRDRLVKELASRVWKEILDEEARRDRDE